MLWISVLAVLDEDQGLDEGLKHTQSKESPRREETRNGKHQPLQHMYNKLNENQQLLWSWFAFIMRSLDQNIETKYLFTHKTADNSHVWKSPYNALQAQY